MQKIERYGVFALVFLLVTILAVSLWGEGKDGGLFFWKKDGAGSDKQAQADRPRPRAPGAAQGAGQAPAPGQSQAPGQTPRAGALELSGENADPAAAQLRAQRQALALQRRAEQQAAAEQPATGQNALPTPGGVGLVDPFALNATAPEQALQGQVGAPALAVGSGAVVRPNPALGAPATTPNVATSRNYVVKNGDTLGEIARTELGASARWTEIAALNGNLDPKRLRTGMTLKLPVGAAATASNVANNLAGNNAASAAPARSATGPRNYTVKSGDTLSAIASSELGSAERWTEIVALNPRLDPDRLAVGAVLALPGAAAAAPNATRPVALDDRRAVASAPRSPTKSKVQ